MNDRLAAVSPIAWSRDIAPRTSLTDLPIYMIQGQNDAYFNSPSDCRPHRTPVEATQAAFSLLQPINPHSVMKLYPGGHALDNVGEIAWKDFINGQQGRVTDKRRNPYRSHNIAMSLWTSYIQ